MRGGSWFLALVGASAIHALVQERETPAEVGLRVEYRGVLQSAESHFRSLWDVLGLQYGTDSDVFQPNVSLEAPPHTLDVTLSATGNEVYTIHHIENEQVSLAAKKGQSDGDELDITTGNCRVTLAISEKEGTDEDDEGEYKKSVGAQIGDGAGLRLSFAIFVIWAFFC